MNPRPFLAALLLALSAVAALADGLIIIHHPPPAHARPHAHVWPIPHPVFAPLEVVYHKVEVTIDGQKATTRVDQEFFNPNHATLEGDYLFPIPRGAQIDKFALRIGDRDQEAELLDAAKARKIYEDIVRQQRDPALLEYTGRSAFRVRIFPIEPRAKKRVQLTYTELLRNDGGLISYLYPLNTEKFSAQPLKVASIKINLAQPVPLKAVYSPTHDVAITRDGERRATIGWETKDARPDRDFQVLFSTAASDVGVSLLTHRAAGDEEGSFLLLAAPGVEKPDARERPNPKDIVFVVDTSGSMAGKKLAQAKKALAFCIENLNAADRFEVVRFSTESEPCFDQLAEATRANRERAQAWVEALKPIGGTAIHDALQHALRRRPPAAERPFMVIFLTDGQPTVGETNEDKIVAAVSRDGAAPTRVFCFGVGTDVNTHLLDKIVERTRAASQFVLPEEDLEVKVSSFFTKIKEPLLTDIKITWPEGVRVTKAYPHPLPDLFRGDQLVLAGRFTGAGEGDVVIEGLVNGRPRRITQRVKFSGGSEHEFIPRLWATRRIGWLLDEIRLRGESTELRDEVVSLARRYAVVTPYTSYLIVEDEARRNVPLALRTFPGIDRDAGARARLREGYDSMRHEKAGDAAAFNARSQLALKNATNVDGAVTLNSFEVSGAYAGGSGRVAAPTPGTSLPAAAPPPVRAAAATAAQISTAQNSARNLAGKTFFQNGAQWVDAEVQRARPAKTVRVAFASSDYFQLLTDKPAAAEWLALGRNVQFTLGDTLYEVTEE